MVSLPRQALLLLYSKDKKYNYIKGATFVRRSIAYMIINNSNILIKTIIIITNNTHKNNKNYNTNNK
jgi:hypothetical protein